MTVHKLDTLIFVGQKAFINKNGKVLVLRDPNHAVNGKKGLDFPGGKYRWGNDIFDELKREVFEETGLEIKIGRPFITWVAQYKNEKKHHSKVYLVAYLCEYLSGDVRLSDEHDHFEWIDEKIFKRWEEDSQYFEALKRYFEMISGT